MRSIELRSIVWLAAVVLLSTAPVSADETWNFAITGAWLEQSSSGNDASFRSQLNLDEGFLLEHLELARPQDEEGRREFRLRAWGFGSAEPSQGADLVWHSAGDWGFELEYRRTESFFALAESDLGLRRDDWASSRFHGELTWDGWKPAKLSLGLGYVERSGLITQPFRELNTLYLLGTDLDETRRSASFRLETRTLPVKIVFEQSLAQLERRNTWFPASTVALDGSDPDLFVDAAFDRREDRDIPVSRLALTWRGERVEVAAGLLLSPGDLDVDGVSFTGFGLGNDRLGRIQFVDDLLGEASFDAMVGTIDVGIGLAPGWTLRLSGGRHDRSQDATLLGQSVLRLTNALGDEVNISQALDEETLFDTVDTSARIEIEHATDKWSVWAGLFDAERDVEYASRGEIVDTEFFNVSRDTEGGLVGFSWHPGRRFRASVEYEHGSFERFVFRTDPETVDRFSLKLKTKLAHGFELRLRGRFEEADNPDAISALDRSSDSLGAGLYWASEDGQRDFAVDLDTVDLTSETALVLPEGGPALSRYDLSLLSLGIHGRAEFGRVRLSGGLYQLEDSGDTWPLEALNANARLAFDTGKNTEIAIFGQFWDYDEDAAQGDDFDVTRYGLAFSWRYE